MDAPPPSYEAVVNSNKESSSDSRNQTTSNVSRTSSNVPLFEYRYYCGECQAIFTLENPPGQHRCESCGKLNLVNDGCIRMRGGKRGAFRCLASLLIVALIILVAIIATPVVIGLTIDWHYLLILYAAVACPLLLLVCFSAAISKHLYRYCHSVEAVPVDPDVRQPIMSDTGYYYDTNEVGGITPVPTISGMTSHDF